MSQDDALGQAANDLQEFVNKIPNAVKAAVQESLDEGMEHSVSIVHVITGALRDSIRTENVSEDGGNLVAGGGSVDYAEHEEFGTSRREGHPYLQPGAEIAFRSMSSNIKDKVEEEIP